MTNPYLGLMVALLLAAGSAGAQFQRDEPREDAHEADKVALPPFPRSENLVAVDMGSRSGFDVSVDLESISVDPDGVVRYSVIASSPGGASNVSFEAIRCKTRERRVYAFGRSDGTWAPARNSKWAAFSRTQVNQIQVVLATDYFCPRGRAVSSVQEARQALRSRGHPDVRAQ